MVDEYTDKQRERLDAQHFATDAERDAFIAENRQRYLEMVVRDDREVPELADMRALCATGQADSTLQSAAESTGAFTPSVSEYCLAGLGLSVEAQMHPERFAAGAYTDRAEQIDLLSLYSNILEQSHIPSTDFNARVFRRGIYDSLSLDVQTLLTQLDDPTIASNPGRLAALQLAGDAFLAAQDPLLSDNTSYTLPLDPSHFEPGPNGETTIPGRPDAYPVYPSIAVDIGYSMTAQALLNNPALVSDPAYLAARRAGPEEVAADRSVLELCFNNVMTDPAVTIGNCAEIGAREAFRHLSPDEITMIATPTTGGNSGLTRF